MLQTSQRDALRELLEVRKNPSLHDVHELASVQEAHSTEQAVHMFTGASAVPVANK